MGNKFFDAYSLLHFAVGVIFRHFGLSLSVSFVTHTLFELIENSPVGVRFIDKHLWFWPGGKKSPDTLTNSVGDTVSFAAGWLLADKLLKNF
jgi:hypothetical protein